MMRNKLLTAFLLGLITALLFGYTRSWTESTPTDNTIANQIDNFNRYLRGDVAERVEDYIGGFNASDSNEGFYHVLFIEKSDTPSTPAAGKGTIYGKAVGGKCELFWIDEDGDEKQITSGGVLKIAAGDFDANAVDQDDIELNNNAYLEARNAADTSSIGLIKLDTTDQVSLHHTSSKPATLETNDPPLAGKDIANKKYVDDEIIAAFPDDDAFGAWASKSNDTAYQAATDGFVCATQSGNSNLLGYSPTTTLRQYFTISGEEAPYIHSSIIFPVRKGDTWKVTGAESVYWLPIGG